MFSPDHRKIMADPSLYLYDAATAEEVGTAEKSGLDIYFPAHIAGWTDVLDCREEPYTEQSIAKNCAYALRVHKKYILVHQSQIAQETPPTEA